MISKIINYFKNLFKTKEQPKKEVYRYYIPLTKEVLENLPIEVQNTLAYYQSQIVKLEEEIAKLKEELERYKKAQEEERLRQIQTSLEVLKKIQKEKRIDILFVLPKPVKLLSYEGDPILVSLGDKYDIIDTIEGMSIEETDYGPYVKLICRTKGGATILIDLGPFEMLPQLIVEPHNIVKQIKMGYIRIRRDSKGRLIPVAIPYEQPRETNVKVFNLDAYKEVLERYPEIKELILSLYQQVNEYRSKYEEAQKMIEELRDELVTAQGMVNVLSEVVKSNREKVVEVLASLRENYRYITDLVTQNMQMSARIMSLEKFSESLLTNMDDIVSKYNVAKAYLTSDEEKIKEAVKEALKEKEEEYPIPPEAFKYIEQAIEKHEKKGETREEE